MIRYKANYLAIPVRHTDPETRSHAKRTLRADVESAPWFSMQTDWLNMVHQTAAPTIGLKQVASQK